MPTSGEDATLVIQLVLAAWADLLTEAKTLNHLVREDSIIVTGGSDRLRRFFGVFELPVLDQQ